MRFSKTAPLCLPSRYFLGVQFSKIGKFDAAQAWQSFHFQKNPRIPKIEYLSLKICKYLPFTSKKNLSTNCSIIGVSQCFPTITVRVRCWWWVWLLSGGKKNKLPLKLETKSHSGGCVLYRPGTNNKRREEKKSFLESFSWWTQKIQLLC